MNILSLDLEMNKPKGEIIQIGAAVIDLITGDILETFCRYINTSEPIDPFIEKLTGIQNRDIKEEGVSLFSAYTDLVALKVKHQCFNSVLQWGVGPGGGDTGYLLKQLKEEVTEFKWELGYRSEDAKAVFRAWCIGANTKLQSGLKKSCHRIGVLFDGPAHNAMKDALNTAKIYHALIKKFKEIENGIAQRAT